MSDFNEKKNKSIDRADNVLTGCGGFIMIGCGGIAWLALAVWIYLFFEMMGVIIFAGITLAILAYIFAPMFK